MTRKTAKPSWLSKPGNTLMKLALKRHGFPQAALLAILDLGLLPAVGKMPKKLREDLLAWPPLGITYLVRFVAGKLGEMIPKCPIADYQI